MGLFNELIPTQKSAILTFIEQQKTLAEVADELDREMQNSSFVPKPLPLQLVYEIPRKKSWMEAITQFQKETDNEISKFDEINEKIKHLHDKVEKVDEIIYFTDEKMKEVKKKNSESSLAIKRVYQLLGDSNFVPRMQKKSIIKSLEPPKKYKSKFTTSSVTTLKPIRALPKETSSVTSFPAKASTSLASLPVKITRNPPKNVKISESVRKLLDEVKEKRENKNSQKQAPVNVINLRLN